MLKLLGDENVRELYVNKLLENEYIDILNFLKNMNIIDVIKKPQDEIVEENKTVKERLLFCIIKGIYLSKHKIYTNGNVI